MAEGGEVVLVVRRVEPARAQGAYEPLVLVDALPAGDDLHAVVEQVEARRSRRVGRVRHRVDGASRQRVARDEDQLAAELVARPLADHALALRVEVAVESFYLVEPLREESLRFDKVDLRDFTDNR